MPDSIAAAAALLRARYGADETAVPGGWNDVLATIVGHRSTRAFLPDPLPPDTLSCLMAAAQSAPTSSNLQAWSVVAVSDPARKARLSVMAGSQRHIDQCPLLLVWLADLARMQQVASDAGVSVDGPEYLEMLLVGVIDAALAAQNAVVALASLDLGSVYIGGIRNRPEQVAAELGLPSQVFAVFGLCVGRPDPAVHADIKPRLPQSAVLHVERYDPEAQRHAVATYGSRMHAFQDGQHLAREDWARKVAARIRSGASLSGRDRIRAALASLGFPLR